MGLTVFFMLVILYILELKYYKENNLSFVCPILGNSFFLISLIIVHAFTLLPSDNKKKL